jgi:hypothetical protein
MSEVLPAPFGPSKPMARPSSAPLRDFRIGRFPKRHAQLFKFDDICHAAITIWLSDLVKFGKNASS